MRIKEVRVELVLRPDEPGDQHTLVATIEHEGEDPTVEFELVKSPDGQMTAEAMTIRKFRGSREVRVPVMRYLDMIASHPALTIGGAKRDLRPKRKRRPLTDEFLRNVADAYRNAPEGERIAAVRAAHPASESQVYRWLKAARERGILSEGDGDGAR